MRPSLRVTGIEREMLLDWLRAFAARAKADRASLTIADLDELARVVERLSPEDDDQLIVELED